MRYEDPSRPYRQMITLRSASCKKEKNVCKLMGEFLDCCCLLAVADDFVMMAVS